MVNLSYISLIKGCWHRLIYMTAVPLILHMDVCALSNKCILPNKTKMTLYVTGMRKPGLCIQTIPIHTVHSKYLPYCIRMIKKFKIQNVSRD